MSEEPSPNDRIDDAVKTRLSRLREEPVETAELEHRLLALASETESATPRHRFFTGWRRLTATAAVVVLAALSGLVLMNLQVSPAIASPEQMVSLHDDATNHNPTAKSVTTIEQARRELVSQWNGVPELPEPPAGSLCGCCVHRVANRKVACLLLKDGQTPVTMMVGSTHDLRETEGDTREIHGKKFTVHRLNESRIVTTEQNGRFVALIGELPETRLLELADEIKF